MYRPVITPPTDGELFFEWNSSLLGILSRPGRHGLASNHVAHGELFYEWSSSPLRILSRPEATGWQTSRGYVELHITTAERSDEAGED
jgi:hypothetical protein